MNELLGLYKTEKVDKVLRRLIPEDFVDDVKQDLFLYLIQLHKSKTKNLIKQKRLSFFAKAVGFYMAVYGRSNYKRLYRAKENYVDPRVFEKLVIADPDYDGLIDIRRNKEDYEDRVIKKIKSSEEELGTPYYRWLANALCDLGSAGKVSKNTGIAKSSVQYGIKILRKYLKDG